MNSNHFLKELQDAKIERGMYTEAQREKLLAARDTLMGLPEDERQQVVAHCVRLGRAVGGVGLGPVGIFEVFVATSQLAARSSR